MAPLTPHWQQPSHGEIQEVVIGKEGFTSKSFSKVTVAPFGLFAKLSFPPCTRATVPTYATVQMGKDAHLNLNSDLVYINHSCEPTLIFDMPTLTVLAGPKGLIPGTELTFFYPSTEWAMAQSFDCFCGTPTCKGRIAGASGMSEKQLEGTWLNGYIRDLLEARDLKNGLLHGYGSLVRGGPSMPAAAAAATTAAAAAAAAAHGAEGPRGEGTPNALNAGKHARNGAVTGPAHVVGGGGASRMGPTSRELSGEMGGDTTSI